MYVYVYVHACVVNIYVYVFKIVLQTQHTPEYLENSLKNGYA